LALKRSEIESLPNTLRSTVKAKKYPTGFDVDEPTKPFLPSDLIEESSPWVCFGRGSSPVNLHSKMVRWRSSFLQFIHLPGGRKATIEFIEGWKKPETIPVGTQVALMEKAFLISDEGEMVLSPMTVSIQLRAYPTAEQSLLGADSAKQCVAEFISRPRDFMRADALMTPISPTDYRVKVLKGDGGKQDVIELVDDPKTSLQPRLQQCVNCHGGAGIRSLGDVARGRLKSFKKRNETNDDTKNNLVLGSQSSISTVGTGRTARSRFCRTRSQSIADRSRGRGGGSGRQSG
jgi:hypothetical protein